ncbi:MAG TPA: DUF6306 domain-containing protein [Anaeromyxobacteraceae bacterium]|jgi:hypothetical protein
MSQEIIDRLNELLECERAGVEVALGLAASEAPTLTRGEMKKFAEDEGWACGSLRKAILRYGGRPSERTGPFAGKVLAVGNEGERVSLMARGHVWTVRRIEALLALDPDPETRAVLAEMRDQHLENVEAANRRAEELQAAPGPPYRGLGFAHLCEGHDRIYFGGWRSPAATLLDCRRAYRQIERYLAALAQECKRSHCAEGKRHLERAEASFERVDPDVTAADGVIALDHALSHAHHALNALLRQYRLPIHDPARFQAFHDVVGVAFQEAL